MKFRNLIPVTATVLALAASGASSAGRPHVFTSEAPGFNTRSVWYDDGMEVTVEDTRFETITLTEFKQAGISGDQIVVRIDKTGDRQVGVPQHPANNYSQLKGSAS